MTTLDPRWGDYSAFHDPRLLAHFQPRSTDILITTAPKAGTTWMQQILHQLRTRGDDNFESINDVVPWLEKPNPHVHWQTRLQQLEALPNPRIFKTHCTAEQTPGIDTVKIILSSRDPRDCCVSMYHHLMNMTDHACRQARISRPNSFDEHLEQWLRFGAWYRNVQSWWANRHRPNLLWLRYQDMKRDLASSLDQIITFLGWHLTAEEKTKILELCSFEWMKRHDDKFSRQDSQRQPFFRPGTFIRAGVVGGYRELLSPAQENKILAKAKEQLPPSCLEFLEL